MAKCNMDEVEEKLTLKSLKKDFEEFKAEVFKRLPVQPLPPVHGFAVAGSPVEIPNEVPKHSVTFAFHDRFKASRQFSEQENGKDWVALANSFHGNNQVQIKSRIDE